MHLPDEILREIIRHATKSTLQTLSFTCTRVRDYSREQLFREICIDVTSEKTDNRIHGIANSHLASYVRKITLEAHQLSVVIGLSIHHDYDEKDRSLLSFWSSSLAVRLCPLFTACSARLECIEFSGEMPGRRSDRIFQNAFGNVGASLLRWMRFPRLTSLKIEFVTIFEAICQPSYDDNLDISPPLLANLGSVYELNLVPRHFFDSYVDQKHDFSPLRNSIIASMPLRKLNVDFSYSPGGMPFAGFAENTLLEEITLGRLRVADDGLSQLLHNSPHLTKLTLYKVRLVRDNDACTWGHLFEGIVSDRLKSFDILDLLYTDLKDDSCQGAQDGKVFKLHTHHDNDGDVPALQDLYNRINEFAERRFLHLSLQIDQDSICYHTS